MADNNAPKKPRGRPKKKNPGSKKATNVPGQNLQKSQQQKSRKSKNYLTKKEVCDPGDDEGGDGCLWR